MTQIAVIGAGYAGLSTDIGAAKANSLTSGISPIAEAGMNKALCTIFLLAGSPYD